jgi:hypothetical protein
LVEEESLSLSVERERGKRRCQIILCHIVCTLLESHPTVFTKNISSVYTFYYTIPTLRTLFEFNQSCRPCHNTASIFDTSNSISADISCPLNALFVLPIHTPRSQNFYVIGQRLLLPNIQPTSITFITIYLSSRPAYYSARITYIMPSSREKHSISLDVEDESESPNDSTSFLRRRSASEISSLRHRLDHTTPERTQG